MLANLLQCDVMLLIMQTVLKRAIDLKARSFSESHLQKVNLIIGSVLFFSNNLDYQRKHTQKCSILNVNNNTESFFQVLHLIGYAVQEQESGAYPFFTFHERATKWDILPLMEELINSARVIYSFLVSSFPF